ncbi:MAG: hypothetical protein ACRYF3_04660 [Janthinobacterium lividum]
MPSLRQHPTGALDVIRARHRISAYVYGNITVLGAVIAATPHTVEDGHALIAVGATALATFVAHILADVVSERVRPDHVERKASSEVREELRDATPIASAAALPVLLMLLGTLDLVSAQVAEILATFAVVVRLAGVGLVTERLSGRPRSATAFWGGIVLAAVSTVIAVLKAVLTH